MREILGWSHFLAVFTHSFTYWPKHSQSNEALGLLRNRRHSTVAALRKVSRSKKTPYRHILSEEKVDGDRIFREVLD